MKILRKIFSFIFTSIKIILQVILGIFFAVLAYYIITEIFLYERFNYSSSMFEDKKEIWIYGPESNFIYEKNHKVSIMDTPVIKRYYLSSRNMLLNPFHDIASLFHYEKKYVLCFENINIPSMSYEIQSQDWFTTSGYTVKFDIENLLKNFPLEEAPTQAKIFRGNTCDDFEKKKPVMDQIFAVKLFQDENAMPPGVSFSGYSDYIIKKEQQKWDKIAQEYERKKTIELQWFEKRKLQELNQFYSKNSYNIFFNQNPVPYAEVNTFTVLPENPFYGKDTEYLYAYGQKLSQSNSKKPYEFLEKTQYLKNNSQIYYDNKIIEEADIETFKILGWNKAQDKNYYYSEDKRQ